MVVCQVPGCARDLQCSRPYNLRQRICEEHYRKSWVFIKDTKCRFCQQCSKFHHLAFFDNNRRSCREQLRKHNQRRKERRAKSKAQTLQNDIQDFVKESFDETSKKIKEILDLSTASFDLPNKRKRTTESINTSNFKLQSLNKGVSGASHNCCENSKQKEGPSANSFWRSLGVSHDHKQFSVSSSNTSFTGLPNSTSVKVGHEIQSGGHHCSFFLDYGHTVYFEELDASLCSNDFHTSLSDAISFCGNRFRSSAWEDASQKDCTDFAGLNELNFDSEKNLTRV